MKIITMIVDAQHRVHLAAVRAPDLPRREIAVLCGGAELAYVAVPPPGVSSRASPHALAPRRTTMRGRRARRRR